MILIANSSLFNQDVPNHSGPKLPAHFKQVTGVAECEAMKYNGSFLLVGRLGEGHSSFANAGSPLKHVVFCEKNSKGTQSNASNSKVLTSRFLPHSPPFPNKSLQRHREPMNLRNTLFLATIFTLTKHLFRIRLTVSQEQKLDTNEAVSTVEERTTAASYTQTFFILRCQRCLKHLSFAAICA